MPLRSKHSKTRTMVLIAVLVAQAIVLSLVERMIPFNFSVPGAKLGLANIVTLTAIYMLPFRQSFLVVTLRILMTAFIVGSFSSFLYSLAGGYLSYFIMALLVYLDFRNLGTIGISVVGAVAHNLGQLLMAAFIIQNAFILGYLPMLMLAAIATGIAVGLTVQYLIKALKATRLFQGQKG
ncbi:Gx transporter family protein [Acidaminobacter hydrogenoformans]|uniref:Heptaprenyl diphosphate synthase n=1 Tax=Acidaminobacter hydrogenoformans DSM 2784 TaxID=1120920 RepID=A0A1G5RQD9_9FIRM|nr:Gx transporter family protein [Acidaminobacter hydrogenoformans]SCZ76315.1 heptaprenyl diphosphate synthase [Acidaminobacter hydrogenoformans DSM 2784]